MTPECPNCGAKDLQTDTFSLPILVKPRDWDGPTVDVDGLECYWCETCYTDTSFPDQIERNHERIAAARAAYQESAE